MPFSFLATHLVETTSVCNSVFYKKYSADGIMRLISVSMITNPTAVSATKVRTISSVLVTDSSRRTEENELFLI